MSARWRAQKGWLLLTGPALAIFLVLYVLPVMDLFRLSLDRFDPGRGILPAWSLDYYASFLGDGYYLSILWRTIRLSALTTLAAAVLAYPLSLYLISVTGWRQTLLLVVLSLPLVTSVIVVSYGWLILLGRTGIVNRALLTLGIVDRPARLMYSETGIVVALVQVQLVFMVISLSAAMQSIDGNLVRAARSLGAGAWRGFWKITFPLSAPGLRTGAVLVFSLSMSAYGIPALIGGPRVKVLSYLIYEQSTSLLNWPFAACMAVILLASTTGLLVLVSLLRQVRTRGGPVLTASTAP